MILPLRNSKREYSISDVSAVKNDHSITNGEVKVFSKTLIDDIICPSDVSQKYFHLPSGIPENTPIQNAPSFINYIKDPTPEPEAPLPLPISEYMNRSITSHQTTYQPHTNPFLYFSNIAEAPVPRLPPGFEQTIMYENGLNASNISRPF